jgi:hypothetical protein
LIEAEANIHEASDTSSEKGVKAKSNTAKIIEVNVAED